MVLSRVLCTLLVVAGCGQSLFDAHGGGGRDGGGGGGDGGGDDGDVPDTCAAPCIADAAADFDGSPGGSGNRWRFLDDRRDHTWAPMTPTSGALVGADARNSIKRCADDPSATACKALPGALLVSTAGQSSPADPALEYPSSEARVIKVVFRAHVSPDSPAHKIRLYRNSREDVLFTAAATPGVTVEHEVTVDAVPGDRFLVALAPEAAGGGTVALHVFVSGTSRSFPSTCQLAVPFTAVGSSTGRLDDLCRGEILSLASSVPTAPILAGGPFLEQGQAGYLESIYHFEGTEVLPSSNATTVQLWIKSENATIADSWAFWNLDATLLGGLGIQFTTAGGLKLGATVVTGGGPMSLSTAYATPQSWHFVRVVHANGMASICLDGVTAKSGALPGPSASAKVPYLGRSAGDTMTAFTGLIDDVRVFAEALPCE